MFTLLDRDSEEETVIYGTRVLEGRTQFLIYNKTEFVWNDSTYFKPVV